MLSISGHRFTPPGLSKEYSLNSETELMRQMTHFRHNEVTREATIE